MKEQLFGIFPCLSALRANRRKIYKILLKDELKDRQKFSRSSKIDDILQHAKEKCLNIDYKPKAYLDRIIGNRPHQNVIMTVSPLSYENLDECDILNSDYVTRTDLNPVAELWIALDQVQDPMNLGAILRSAGYFGISGVIASAKNSCRLSPTVSKASAGAMEWMKIYGTTNLPDSLCRLASYGWEVIGSTMPGDDSQCHDVIPCHQLVINKPSILVLGNEGAGIRDKVLQCCTKLTTIQSTSNTCDQNLDSLNVSVATGILIFSLLHGR